MLNNNRVQRYNKKMTLKREKTKKSQMPEGRWDFYINMLYSAKKYAMFLFTLQTESRHHRQLLRLPQMPWQAELLPQQEQQQACSRQQPSREP